MFQLCSYQQNLTHDTINRDSLGKFGPHIVRLIRYAELTLHNFYCQFELLECQDLDVFLEGFSRSLLQYCVRMLLLSGVEIKCMTSCSL